MTVATKELQTLAVLECDSAQAADDDVRAQVHGLLNSLYPRNNMVERRGEQRFPFPHLLHLTPVSGEGVVEFDETVVVVGKHLSERGLGFYHQQPLPNRQMIVSIELDTGALLGIIIDLTWCRFTKQGWYESGGRFLRLVKSPLEVSG